MAESAAVEPVVEPVAQPVSEPSDWDKMTPKQRTADIAKLDARLKPKVEPEIADEETLTIPETTEQSAGGEEISAADDAAPAPETVVEGEGEGEAAVAADWLDGDTRDFATTMGLTDDDLSEFGSREELDRALRIIDRRAFEAGKAAQQPPNEPIEQPVVQQPVKPAMPLTSAGDPLADLSQFRLKTTNEGGEFDPDAAEPLNRFMEAASTTIKDLRTRVAQFEQQSRQEVQWRQQEALVNLQSKALASLHSLGNAELFGKVGEKPTAEQAANIEKAIDAHFTHARGLFSQGRQVAPTPAFLKAAVHLAFGDQLSKNKERQILDKLRKQSGRRSGGAGAKHVPSKPPDDETSEQRRQRLAADPEVAAATRRFFTEGE